MKYLSNHYWKVNVVELVFHDFGTGFLKSERSTSGSREAFLTH